MKCPNCGHLPLVTKQTMQSDNKTYRYKRCPSCLWNFTSVEEIPDTPPVISSAIRKGKSK
jgi:transcriptional regulator NrdR family protein